MRVVRTIKITCLMIVSIIFSTTAVTASDTVIRGTVTGGAGTPIRGALVKATMGNKSISRFTQQDGRYDIKLPNGPYDVSAEAYGFEPKQVTRDTAKPGDTNFTLSAKMDVTRLTTAEMESLLPDTPDATLLKIQCNGCHGLSTVLRMRGSKAPMWQAYLPVMGKTKMLTVSFPPAHMAALTQALEKYFGPESKYFGPRAEPPKVEQIKHVPISDEALGATIREYTTPTPKTMPHSVTVDSRGVAFFSDYDFPSNRLSRFDPETEKFDEYPLPVPNAAPHTGALSKDGRTFWVPSAKVGIPAKLFALDIATGKIRTYEWPEKTDMAGHTTILDPTGSVIWFSTTANDELWSFDTKTEKFRAHKFPVPDRYPDESRAGIVQTAVEGGTLEGRVAAGSYDVVVNSKGTVWFSSINLGTVTSLDPKTDKTKTYKAPGMLGVRGLTVDAQDNVWFCEFFAHKLGKLDVKSGTVKLYAPPTPGASPYGLTVDRRTGYVWFADMTGNNITRFDPKTEQFVEYPIPTRNSYSRFIGVDPKGRVFFTEFWNGKIGVLDPGRKPTQSASLR